MLLTVVVAQAVSFRRRRAAVAGEADTITVILRHQAQAEAAVQVAGLEGQALLEEVWPIFLVVQVAVVPRLLGRPQRGA
jgi:hypothetical protein